MQEGLDMDRIVILDKCIGRGAFGIVQLGVNEDTGQQAAVKELHFPSGEKGKAMELMENAAGEIMLMKQLNHPNIVRFLGAKRDAYTLYVYMEYVSGGTVASLVRNMTKLRYPLARKILGDVLRGVDYLHHRSICHRDIKCENILLHSDGTAKLGDFGTSKFIQTCFSLCAGLRSMCGTPWYMAPEVISGEPYGLPVDIWAVGGVLYEMTTGQRPYHEYENLHAVMFHIASQQSPPSYPPDAATGAVDFMQWCFKKEPRDRMRADELLVHPYACGDEHGTVALEDDDDDGYDDDFHDVEADAEDGADADVEDFSPSPLLGTGTQVDFGSLSRCGCCDEALAVFSCRQCTGANAGKMLCPMCWASAHPRDEHKREPILFTDPQWAKPSSPLTPLAEEAFNESRSATASMTPRSLGSDDGVVMGNGQYVGLLRREDLHYVKGLRR